MADEWDRLRDALGGVARSIARLRADLSAAGASTGEQHHAVPPPADTPLEPPPLQRLFAILDGFPALVGYLQGRRRQPEVVSVNSEAQVQDLLYFSLKPAFPDLVYEEPTTKGAAGYSVGDFAIPSLKLILEAKFIASATDVKTKADEIAEDIWKYATQTDCQRIVFFVYDPQLLIPDRANYLRALSASADEFTARGRAVEIQTVIKPA